MRFPLTFSPAVLVLILVLVPSAYAAPRKRQSYRKQHPSRHAVSAGAYVAAGLNTAGQPVERVTGLQGQVGLYADWVRFRVQPGVDARLQGEQYSLPALWASTPGGNAGAKLIGPRISVALDAVRPFAEMLFGPAHLHDVPQKDDSGAEVSGTMKMGVAGVDFDAAPHLRIRVEYSVGSLGAPGGYLMQGVTTGLVLRFP